MAACLGRVLPSRDEEHVGPGPLRADHLLRDASDRKHVAVELDLPGRRHLVPAVDRSAQLFDDVEREREPCRGPADAAEVDLDVDRQLDVGGLLDLDADDRAAALRRARDRPDLDGSRLVTAAHLELHRLSRLVQADQATEVVGRPDRLAVDRHDHVRGRELSRGWRVVGHRDHEGAFRLGLDVVAELAQRNRGGDLLGTVHLPQVLLPTLAVVRPRWHERLLGDETRALGPRRRDELLQQRRLPEDDVDVVDPARRVRLLSRDLDLVRQRLRRVGEDEVAVRRQHPERAEDKCAKRQPGGDEPADPHVASGVTGVLGAGRRRRRSRCR